MKSCSSHKTETRLRKSIALTASAATLLVAALPARADTFTWDGGGTDGNWSTPENWDPDGAPDDLGSFDTFVFDGTSQLTISVDIPGGNGGWNVDDFIFNPGAGAFTISGPEFFDMLGTGTGTDTTSNIINNSTNTQTITANLLHRPDFNTGMVFNANAGGIVVSGTISRGGNASTPIIIGGSNTVVFSGANDYDTDTSIGLSLVSDDFQSYTVNAGPGGDWNQAGTGTVRVEAEGGGNQYLGFGWEGGDPSGGSSRSATRVIDTGIGASDAAFVTFRARTESDNGEWYYGVSDTPPTSFNNGFATMNYCASVGLVEDATAMDGKVNLVAGVEGGAGTTVLTNLNTNQWYNIGLFIDHAAATFDVYVDGVKVNGSALAFQATPAGDIDQFTVTGGGGSRFDGQLDDLDTASTATLRLDGTHTGAGSYIINSGSQLTGTGSITLATGESVGANALGAVAPGDRSSSSTGTLAVTGDVALGNGALAVRIDGANDTSDLLAITGNLDVTGSTLDLSNVISAPDDASYTLATYSGTLTGPVFTTVLGLPVGYSVSYATAGEIRLQAGGDTDPPTVFTFAPADNATGVLATDDLVVTFSEVIQAGTGNITLKRTSDDSTVETFDVASSPRLDITGAVVTINPTDNLVGGTEYYVLIDATVIEDTSNNAFAGISDTTEWSFTAEDTAPTITGLNPADDATGVFPSSVFTVTFDEEVAAGTGNITIRLASDDSVVENFDVSSDVTISGMEATFTPTTPLAVGTDHYVTIDAGAIEDLASNSHAGIGDATTWSFTTTDTAPIVFERFLDGGPPLNGETADVFDAAVTTAGGSATWAASGAFFADGTVSTFNQSSSAHLNLGSFINDTKGTANGKFELTMTISEVSGEWIALGFASLNTHPTNQSFTGGGSTSIATILRREPGDNANYMFGGPRNTNQPTGPNITAPDDRTYTVSLDLTPAGGYDGSTNFGTVTWSEASVGVTGSFTYTVDRDFGSILVSKNTDSGGTISALALTQITSGPASPYDTWATGFGLSGPDADSMADTENSGAGDGLEQIFEFAFGTNPNVSDNAPLEITSGTTFTPGTPIIDIEFEPLNVSYRFVRRVDHASAGLTYTPRFTSDGMNFEDGTDPPTVVVPDDGSGYEVVEVPFPLFLTNGMKSKISLARIQVSLDN